VFHILILLTIFFPKGKNEILLLYLRNVTKFDEGSYATTFPTRVLSNIVVTRKILLTRILAVGGAGGGVGIGLE